MLHRIAKFLRLSIYRNALLAVAVLTLCLTALLACAPTDDTPKQPSGDTVPPTFSGVCDMEVLQGDGISYRSGVTANDETDGEVPFTVDSSAVDRDVPGVYEVIYRAVDAAGNETIAKANVTVKKRTVTYEQLWETVDPLIEREGFASLSCRELSEQLYWYIKGKLSYTSTSDKSDWIAEAHRGLLEGTGDCFTYYAVARAFFERLGISVLTVQRSPNVLPSTHYWLLVNTGSDADPAWYHWDVCPHYMEHPLTSILLTDEELLAYNDRVPHYYTFDRSQYPATPLQ